MLPDAIETAITSADRVHVANLIEQFMERQRASQPAQYMQNPQEFHTLRRWLDALPIELIQQRPLLCLGQATTLLLVAILEQRPFAPSDIARMEEGFQLAQQGFRAQGDMLGLASALILHATIERHFGHITEAANAVRQALEYLPDQDVMWRSSGLGILGIEELFTGQVEKALQTALAAHAFCEQLNYPAIMRANTVLLSRVYYEHGELHLAARHSREMLVSARQEQDYDDIGDAQLGLAQISYEWNDLAAAQQQATEALEMGQRLANEEVQVEATLVLVRIKQAQGK
ncbi:MAG: hypothetical protein M3Y81_11385, partial [Chloroflexota bacterium]|nr:hypothetical protein [Chloroflexota bacterium]